jgi:hypothetical protein
MALIVGGTTVTGTQTLDATKLTGNLPEISGADLTNLPAPSAANVGSAYAQVGSSDVGTTLFGRFVGTGNANHGSNVTQVQYTSVRNIGTAAPLSSGQSTSGTSMAVGHRVEGAGTVFKRIS